MTVGVKYCGGCNPRYDRVSEVNRLKKEYPALEFCAASAGEVYDYVLVVCGCSAVCASHETIKARREKVILWKTEDYAGLRELFDAAV